MNAPGLEVARDTVVVTIRQRCFWLFAALLLLIVSVPFLEESPAGRVMLNVTSLLALPTAVFLLLSLRSGETHARVLSQAFGTAFYFAVTSYLLSYTLRRDVMTADKLYGAAAAFLLLGVLWSYLYAILLAFHPGALLQNGAPMGSAAPSTLLFFSFTTLTAAGLSDILPALPLARMLCSLEMITGVLFIAVLIARLAGSYPPRDLP